MKRDHNPIGCVIILACTVLFWGAVGWAIWRG